MIERRHMIELKDIELTKISDTAYMVKPNEVVDGLNALNQAVRELQAQSEFHSEHLAGVMAKAHGKEKSYTVSDIRKLYDAWFQLDYENSSAERPTQSFPNWLDDRE